MCNVAPTSTTWTSSIVQTKYVYAPGRTLTVKSRLLQNLHFANADVMQRVDALTRFLDVLADAVWNSAKQIIVRKCTLSSFNDRQQHVRCFAKQGFQGQQLQSYAHNYTHFDIGRENSIVTTYGQLNLQFIDNFLQVVGGHLARHDVNHLLSNASHLKQRIQIMNMKTSLRNKTKHSIIPATFMYVHDAHPT